MIDSLAHNFSKMDDSAVHMGEPPPNYNFQEWVRTYLHFHGFPGCQRREVPWLSQIHLQILAISGNLFFMQEEPMMQNKGWFLLSSFISQLMSTSKLNVCKLVNLGVTY